MTSIIAHRGASADAPENTVEAFKLAWEHGADAVEMDLRMSRDGGIVVIHDEDLKRMAGDSRRVRDVDCWQLLEMDVGRSRQGSKWAGVKIPHLAQALEAVPGHKQVFLELKEGEEMLPAVQEVISHCRLDNSQINLISFNRAVLARAKVLMPQLAVSLIVDYPSVLGFERLIGTSLDHGFSGLHVARDWPLDVPRVNRAHEAGLKVHVWTVDDGQRGMELVKAGVDGLTTNMPQKLRRLLKL